MKILARIMIALIAGAIGAFIGGIIGDWVIDALNNTGGMVTASDILEAKLCPVLFGIAGACIGWIFSKDLV